MQTLVERGCGMDVHQATVVPCLLIVLKNGKVQKQEQTFGATTRELMSLREWLLSEGCTHVAMESTGVYWKPIYVILEGAFEIVVAKAQWGVRSLLTENATHGNSRNSVIRAGRSCGYAYERSRWD